MSVTPIGRRLASAAAPALLVLLAGVGVLTLLYFFHALWFGHNLGALSLPLLALVGGTAATFNPCALPALPGFLALGTQDRRPGPSVAAAIGAIAVVFVLGAFVAAVGVEVQDLVAPRFRGLQLAAGLLLVLLAGLHLMGQAHRLPLVSPLTALGSRIWEKALARPSWPSSVLLGAGFVAVGGA